LRGFTRRFGLAGRARTIECRLEHLFAPRVGPDWPFRTSLVPSQVRASCVVVFESLALNGALVLDASQLPHDAKVLILPISKRRTARDLGFYPVSLFFFCG
jgi:hypothetical protein